MLPHFCRGLKNSQYTELCLGRGVGKEYPMREFIGPVRFGTEKVIGFPPLAAIFKNVMASDSSVYGEGTSGAQRRIFGLAQC
jgi:hypothetical protein